MAKALSPHATGWLLWAGTLLVYLLTLQRTVSFWDCGEFIATSYSLGVPHPPGAPLYTLLAHLFTLLAPAPRYVALCSNLLSALAAAFTNAFLFWTLSRLLPKVPFGRPASQGDASSGGGGSVPALVGTLCYALCDTAWFSAVESEVYALSMLLSSAILYCAVLFREQRDPRLLLLIGLLSGLTACVHEMGLLVLPAVVALLARPMRGTPWRKKTLALALALLFFLIGLTPYLIIPLCAQANPYLNNSDPSTTEAFLAYLKREQYENAPLIYPRIWRHHDGDAEAYAYWSGNHQSELLNNVEYTLRYQLGRMYLNYWVQNFAGRHGWELLWLPLLLGVLGFGHQWRHHRREFWPIALLALFAGPLLALYLNMPPHQPRERDYAFVLSFYAYAFWIAYGVSGLQCEVSASKRRVLTPRAARLTLLIPMLMLCVNYPHNDRSRNTSARDVAWNILHSCEPDAILFTTGDNDTFPLWYLQQVEGVRPDVRILNVSLLTTEWYARQMAPECLDREGRQLRGVNAVYYLIANNIGGTPIYLTHYTRDKYADRFEGHLGLTGNAFRLTAEPCPEVLKEESLRHLPLLRWSTHTTSRSDICERRFHKRYQDDTALIRQR